MGVVSIKETYGDDSAAYGDINNNREARVWRVTTTGRDVSKIAIFQSSEWSASTIPQYGDVHPEYSLLTCKGVELNRQDRSPIHWIATARYDTAPVSESEKQRLAVPNPVNRVPRVAVDGVTREEYRLTDADGDTMCNSAGELYEPEAFEITNDLLRVRQNVATLNAAWRNLKNTRNVANIEISDGVTTFAYAAGSACLRQFSIGELQYENGVAHYPITAEIETREDADAWRIDKLDAGFHKLVSGKPTKILVKDEDGNSVPAAVEVPLNGSGGLLTTPDDPDTFSHRYFKRYKTADWSILPFVTIPTP